MIRMLESGNDINLNEFLLICEAVGMDLECLGPATDAIIPVGNDSDAPCHLRIRVNGSVCDVYLSDVSVGQYKSMVAQLSALLQSSIKRRDCVAQAIRAMTRLCPKANPSDLYHHVIYRQYLDPANHLKGTTADNLNQSWVRTSGEGFEQALADHYNPALQQHGIALVPTFSRTIKKRVIAALGLHGQVTDSKIDIGVTVSHNGAPVLLGGVHAKASLAERVTDDIPASRIMMQTGFLSILSTLDVKSFGPPQGNLLNEGELGTLKNPSDKRRYVEVQGDFSACFSYNTRTVPSPSETQSGKHIYTVDFANPQDVFHDFLVAESKAWLRKTKDPSRHRL
ncbi:MAG: hypothetical protein DHS20C16_03650 [Phycisphaerae bacterium]|nr:MAG: hypothetical protein DHS20C16_03650 [Phycisphaerae bacterium]